MLSKFVKLFHSYSVMIDKRAHITSVLRVHFMYWVHWSSLLPTGV